MSQRDVMPSPPRRLGRPPRGSEGDVLLRVLAAAKVVFLTEGFEAAGIDAIAGSAGPSKKTIDTRFASKVDLFEAVCVRFIEENVPSIEKVAARRPGMTYVKRETLKRSLDFFLRACRP